MPGIYFTKDNFTLQIHTIFLFCLDPSRDDYKHEHLFSSSSQQVIYSQTRIHPFCSWEILLSAVWISLLHRVTILYCLNETDLFAIKRVKGLINAHECEAITTVKSFLYLFIKGRKGNLTLAKTWEIGEDLTAGCLTVSWTEERKKCIKRLWVPSLKLILNDACAVSLLSSPISTCIS